MKYFFKANLFFIILICLFSCKPSNTNEYKYIALDETDSNFQVYYTTDALLKKMVSVFNIVDSGDVIIQLEVEAKDSCSLFVSCNLNAAPIIMNDTTLTLSDTAKFDLFPQLVINESFFDFSNKKDSIYISKYNNVFIFDVPVYLKKGERINIKVVNRFSKTTYDNLKISYNFPSYLVVSEKKRKDISIKL